MKIEIKNIDLSRVIAFLEKEEFKGMQSIMRSKLTNFLTEQLQEVAKGEKTIHEDFKDDKENLESELKTYFDEVVVVEGGNMLKPLNVIKKKIEELTNEECEREFSGQDAYALSVLYDAFSIGGDA